MTKAAQVMRFYSLDEIMEFMSQGGEYPRHNLYCYDQIKDSDILVECIEYNRNSFLNRLGKKIKMLNLQQQINILKSINKYDVIYCPFIEDVFLLALLKVLKFHDKPLVGLGLDAYAPYKKHFLKKFRQKLLRYIYLNGFNSLIFITKKTYQESTNYGKLKNSHGFSESWGADFEFCDSYISKQTSQSKQNYIYSTGGSGRDFKTLIEAFKEIDFDLRITTKKDSDINAIKDIPSNVHLNNTIKPGLYSVGLMREEYYNSLAVALPLHGNIQNAPIGLTVFWEALGMGKPVICTYNKLHQFNLEKEKVGFIIDDKDVIGWRDAINYLINNPEEAREMGERGKYLCKKKYNHKLFSKEIIERIKQSSIPQVKEVSAVSS